MWAKHVMSACVCFGFSGIVSLVKAFGDVEITPELSNQLDTTPNVGQAISSMITYTRPVLFLFGMVFIGVAVISFIKGDSSNIVYPNAEPESEMLVEPPPTTAVTRALLIQQETDRANARKVTESRCLYCGTKIIADDTINCPNCGAAC